jgi:predicted dehydrogenase
MRDTGISRRRLLQTGLTAGAAVALGSGLSIARGQNEAKPVRIGVVGVGARGSGLISTLLALPNVAIPAVCDIDESHARQGQDLVEKTGAKRPEAYTKGERDWANLVARDDLDAVIDATPWEWHAPISIASMRAGKYAGVEVPAAITIDECWELIKTSAETRVPCMMLENVCWFRDVMAVNNIIRQGLFGELLHCAGGYQHDVRFRWIIDGKMSWRGKHSLEKDGCLYPTHQAGPIARWLGINHGDRFTQLVSMSTKSVGINNYASEKIGPDSELAKTKWAIGDVNTTLLKTANGKTVTLYHDCSTPRPYDLMFRVQGTKGIWMQDMNRIYLHGRSAHEERWEGDEFYLKQYDHDEWKQNEAEAKKDAGHGGADYLTLRAFVEAVRAKSPTPIDVYDSVTWSAIHPLSVESVKRGSASIEFPDFTNGNWRA